jgi:peptide/nickel transport system substrate-binding protein
MCLDRDAVKKLVYAGTGSSTWSPISPDSFAYEPVAGYPYDPDKAKSMFAKAGASGLQFGIEVPAGYPTLSQTATIWQAGLAKAGVTLKVNVSELQVWLDKYIKRTYDSTMNTFLSTPDPNYFYSVIMQAHLGDDYPNAAMSQLVQQGVQTLKNSARAPIYQKLQDMLIHDLPVMMIYRAPFLSVTTTGTTGLAINGEGDFDLNAVTA